MNKNQASDNKNRRNLTLRNTLKFQIHQKLIKLLLQLYKYMKRVFLPADKCSILGFIFSERRNQNLINKKS